MVTLLATAVKSATRVGFKEYPEAAVLAPGLDVVCHLATGIGVLLQDQNTSRTSSITIHEPST